MSFREDLFQCIGRTPIFLLPRLSKSAGAQLFAKAEHLNPGGSVKDRVALDMVLDAEARGVLKPGSTLVEATAGNTGIGLAWIAAARGYRFVAVMTEADRGPKTETMEAMGTEVVLLPKGPAWDSEDGALGVAARIAEERQGLFLNQFENPANPAAHEKTTAVEILEDLPDGLDALVVGVGTGGTATGLGRGLQPAWPDLRILGVSAEGSYLGSELENDRIAGITPDFPPQVFDPDLLTMVETFTGEAAAEAAKRLMTLEGIPAGHSSGALLLAAEAEAQRHPGSRILLLICDGRNNYPGLGH